MLTRKDCKQKADYCHFLRTLHLYVSMYVPNMRSILLSHMKISKQTAEMSQ